ncbi:MAG: hypothetical protein J6S24_02490, partial [Lentisphaeria bacterium]|nr:hypothetical protein [Lentisphaeria bacterium]
MKKTLLLVLSAIFLCSVQAAQNNTVPAEKKAAKTEVKKAPKKKKTNYYPNLKVPALSDKQSWTMVVVPDIQGYVSKATNHGILDMMMAWLVTYKTPLNISQVLFTGDLVDWNQGGAELPDRKELIGEEQWKA